MHRFVGLHFDGNETQKKCKTTKYCLRQSCSAAGRSACFLFVYDNAIFMIRASRPEATFRIFTILIFHRSNGFRVALRFANKLILSPVLLRFSPVPRRAEKCHTTVSSSVRPHLLDIALYSQTRGVKMFFLLFICFACVYFNVQRALFVRAFFKLLLQHSMDHLSAIQF